MTKLDTIYNCDCLEGMRSLPVQQEDRPSVTDALEKSDVVMYFSGR